jgi:hypothetical protein
MLVSGERAKLLPPHGAKREARYSTVHTRIDSINFLLTSTASSLYSSPISERDTPGGDGFSVPFVIFLAASSEV